MMKNLLFNNVAVVMLAIPDAVEGIKSKAFYRCNGLENIILYRI